MRILLTGASGNLGTALRRSSEQEFLPIGRTDWASLPGALASGVDAVVHAAWDLRTPLTQNPAAILDANLMTTMRLLEACREHQVPRFGLVSTCGVYGDSVNTAEDTPCAPVSVNGITKLLNERVVEAFCEAWGIECQIYRLFNMYGGHDQFSILSHLRRALEHGTPFVLNNDGIAQRDFVHVDDVARILVELVQRPLPVVRVNVGTGRSTRISDIVDAVRRLRPDLLIRHQAVREAALSRADTTTLESIVGPQRFVDVMSFVEREFADDAGTAA